MNNMVNIENFLNDVNSFILLLLRAKKSEPIPGALWLQKEFFLLSNLFRELQEQTDFEPYFLGPYSEIVENEAEELKNSNLVKVESGKISLTPSGRELADLIAENVDRKIIEKIDEFKEFLNDMSKDELLAFVYFSYPSKEELEKESIEYRDLLPKRKQIAISLYRKGKISAQKAAQIAGLDIEDFIKSLR